MLGLQSYVQRIVAPLIRQVRGMVLRGSIKIVNDALMCQGLQVELTSDRLSDEVERFEDYGLTSHPFVDAEVLCLTVGANAGHKVVARVNDRRHRPTDMAEGDVCLYTDKGERVYLDSGNDIVHLGAKSASDFVALAADVLSELQAVKADFDTLKGLLVAHVHPGVAAGGTYTQASTTLGGFTPHSPSSVAATKTKAE